MFQRNISLHQIDIVLSEFGELSENSYDFEPQCMKGYVEKRNLPRNCLVPALKHMVKVSNSNLLRDANGLLAD